MILNSEQSRAVREPGTVCLSACPGSGKTRTIAAKLANCIDTVRDTSRRIACITYTHAAVNEIEKRLREYGAADDADYCEIGTIHSFCLSNILRPFHHLTLELRRGFDVLPADSERWRVLVEDLADKYGVDRLRLDGFASIQRTPDGELVVPPEIPDAAALELVTYLDANALVNFSDIVYHSARLIRSTPFIGRGLASRFEWILVDEFQDTSDSQVRILREIEGHGMSRLFLVGDPNQSIMAFAGADPQLIGTFPVEVGARTDLQLRGNYRSSARIVSHAERLIPTSPSMRAVGPDKDCDVEPALVHVADRITGILEHYLPAVDALGISLGDAAVLAPWWFTLYQLARELTDRGVPVLGPGARPYRGTRLFAPLAEALCAYVEDGDPQLYRSAQRALFVMLLNITGNPDWRVYSYDGRRCLCQLASVARGAREAYGGEAVRWLRKIALETGEHCVREDFLDRGLARVIAESADDMVRDMSRNKVDIANLSVSDLGLFARPRDCLQLLTMHASKGREFDAVAIIDLHDGRVPHYSCRSREQYDEARRQLYVAITRAKKLLMYFTDSTDRRNRPSPFLVEMGLVAP